jgi:hypothetical protein
MAIQVAVLEMGCNDLQLYGCDGDITTDPTRNNFSSDYLRVSALPQWYVDAKNTALNTAQAIMLVECEGRGVKVTNVSL